MMSDGYRGTLAQSIAEGKVSEAAVNAACRRVLEAKWKLGLFADPYRYCNEKRAKKEIFTPAHRAEARNIAAETFVLLKNNGKVLPLQKKGRIALVGPLASSKRNMSGTWSLVARLDENKTLLQAMKEAVGDKAEVLYARGSNFMHDTKLEANAGIYERDKRSDKEILDEAIAVSRNADVIVAAVGESSEMSGECCSRSSLDMPDAQRDMLAALKKLGKPIVLLNFSGRPTVMTWENDNFDAILNVWFGGCETADAICDVLFGDKCPSGKLTATMPKSVGQIPLYYNHLNTGRPLEEGKWFSKFRSNYLDIDNDPLFPFGYRLSQRATITVRHHVHVGTGVQGKCRHGLEIAQTVVHHLGDGSIVGHDHSLEAPHATQHIGKQPAVGGGRYALEGVEGGHYAHGACIDGGLVGRHVIVEHAPAAHVDRVIIAPRLRATVKSKMFDARHHRVGCRQVGALRAFNHGAGDLRA